MAHKRGRPEEVGSVGEDAEAVASFLTAGLSQYGIVKAHLWNDAIASFYFERKAPDDGAAWVRKQFSRLAAGGHKGTSGRWSAVSFSIQRDLFRLIQHSIAARNWRSLHGGPMKDPWLADVHNYPAFLELVHKEPAAIIDPSDFAALATLLIEDLGNENIPMKRRSAAIERLTASLTKRAPNMAWQANVNWVTHFGETIAQSIEGTDAVAMTGSVLGQLNLILWPDQ